MSGIKINLYSHYWQGEQTAELLQLYSVSTTQFIWIKSQRFKFE